MPALVSISVIDDAVPVARVEERRNTLPPRDTILRHVEYTELEPDSSVSCFRPYFLADDNFSFVSLLKTVND